MTELLTLPTAIKLAQTKHKEIQAMNNTTASLTMIYYCETTKKRKS
jgi:hypothetical protein